MKIFSGRVAVVTGGASGIGYGIVCKLLEEGMKIVIVDIDRSHLDEVRGAFGPSQSLHLIQADVADRAQMRAAAEAAQNAFGKIHVLCNNAGIGGSGNVDDEDFEGWDRVLAINLGGAVNGIKLITPLIRRHGEGGHIVNTVSMSGVVRLPEFGAYSTTKFALRGLTDSLRLSMACYGIGVSGLYPGLTRTRIMAEQVRTSEAAVWAEKLMAAAMDPLEVGAAVVAGIRSNAAYIFTHAEFRDEVHEVHAAIEAAFPEQRRACERLSIEAGRHQLIAEREALPIKD